MCEGGWGCTVGGGWFVAKELSCSKGRVVAFEILFCYRDQLQLQNEQLYNTLDYVGSLPTQGSLLRWLLLAGDDDNDGDGVDDGLTCDL